MGKGMAENIGSDFYIEQEIFVHLLYELLGFLQCSPVPESAEEADMEISHP